MESAILNLSDLPTKRKLLTQLSALQGPHRVEIKRWRPKHSQRMRAYYFVAVVSALSEFFKAQGDSYSLDECHEIIKENTMAPVEIVNHNTGEVMGTRRRSIREMDNVELSAHIEKAIAFLGESGVHVQPPMRGEFD